jgi:hypothetical protein
MVWKGIIRLVPSTWNDLKENSPCERFLLTLNIDYKKEETIQAPHICWKKSGKTMKPSPFVPMVPFRKGKTSPEFNPFDKPNSFMIHVEKSKCDRRVFK